MPPPRRHPRPRSGPGDGDGSRPLLHDGGCGGRYAGPSDGGGGGRRYVGPNDSSARARYVGPNDVGGGRRYVGPNDHCARSGAARERESGSILGETDWEATQPGLGGGGGERALQGPLGAAGTSPPPPSDACEQLPPILSMDLGAPSHAPAMIDVYAASAPAHQPLPPGEWWQPPVGDGNHPLGGMAPPPYPPPPPGPDAYAHPPAYAPPLMAAAVQLVPQPGDVVPSAAPYGVVPTGPPPHMWGGMGGPHGLPVGPQVLDANTAAFEIVACGVHAEAGVTAVPFTPDAAAGASGYASHFDFLGDAARDSSGVGAGGDACGVETTCAVASEVLMPLPVLNEDVGVVGAGDGQQALVRTVADGPPAPDTAHAPPADGEVGITTAAADAPHPGCVEVAPMEETARPPPCAAPAETTTTQAPAGSGEERRDHAQEAQTDTIDAPPASVEEPETKEKICEPPAAGGKMKKKKKKERDANGKEKVASHRAGGKGGRDDSDRAAPGAPQRLTSDQLAGLAATLERSGRAYPSGPTYKEGWVVDISTGRFESSINKDLARSVTAIFNPGKGEQHQPISMAFWQQTDDATATVHNCGRYLFDTFIACWGAPVDVTWYAWADATRTRREPRHTATLHNERVFPNAHVEEGAEVMLGFKVQPDSGTANILRLGRVDPKQLSMADALGERQKINSVFRDFAKKAKRRGDGGSGGVDVDADDGDGVDIIATDVDASQLSGQKRPRAGESSRVVYAKVQRLTSMPIQGDDLKKVVRQLRPFAVPAQGVAFCKSPGCGEVILAGMLADVLSSAGPVLKAYEQLYEQRRQIPASHV